MDPRTNAPHAIISPEPDGVTKRKVALSKARDWAVKHKFVLLPAVGVVVVGVVLGITLLTQHDSVKKNDPNTSTREDLTEPAQGSSTPSTGAGSKAADEQGASGKDPNKPVQNTNPQNTGGAAGSTGSGTGSGSRGGSGSGGTSPSNPSTGGGSTAPSNPGGGTTPPASGSRPNTSNTGIPVGTTLTNYTGPTSSNASNVTYDGVNFTATGGYQFYGNNITIRNSRFASSPVFYGDNLRIERSEIINGFALSGTQNVVVEYTRLHSLRADGIQVTSDTGPATNITLANNLIHDSNPSNDAHADGLQVRGVDGLTITNNVFDMGVFIPVGTGGPKNSAIFLEGGNGGNKNITLNGNYLNGGGYIMYINTGVNYRITNNRFGPDGKFGTILNSSSASTITQWSGNVMDDSGATVNK